MVIRADLEAGGLKGVVDVREELKSQLKFLTDTNPVEAVKTRCRDMRAAGKSYKEICAATGLHRDTAYKHVRAGK